MEYKQYRNTSADELRGLAIVLMVISHVLWFISTGENVILNYLRDFSDDVCMIVELKQQGV